MEEAGLDGPVGSKRRKGGVRNDGGYRQVERGLGWGELVKEDKGFCLGGGVVVVMTVESRFGILRLLCVKAFDLVCNIIYYELR